MSSRTARKRKREERRLQELSPLARAARRLRRVLRPWFLVPAAGAATVIVVVLGIVLQPGGSNSASNGPDGNWVVKAPDMEVPDFGVRATSWSGGDEFVLSQSLSKPTVMYFVAAWCFTCIPETQALAKIHDELGDQLNILIFDVDTTEDEDDLKRFKDRADGADHLWVMDEGNRISQAYNVRTLDTTIIIDRSGEEAFRDSVPTGYDKLKSELTAVIENRPVTPVPELDLPGMFYPDIGRDHLQPGETYDGYLSDPPTSGPHDPEPAPWGPYDTPIPKEQLVHNLEHGGLLVLYTCPEGCPELVDELEPFVGRYAAGGVKLVLAPYRGMDSRLALVAWGYLDRLDELDPARIAKFLEADLGSRAPEASVR